MSEKEALLGSKENRLTTPYNYSQQNGANLFITPLNSADELSTTVSTGVFRSKSVLQKPDDNLHLQGVPVWRAVFLIVNAALGAGILNFPQAYAECGSIATAVTIQMVSAMCCYLVWQCGWCV